MGTSKGYIPPKSPEWSQAKGAVTRMSGKNYNKDNARKAIEKYAEAYSKTHLGKSSFSNVAGNFLNFLNDIKNNDFDSTIEKYGLDSIRNKNGSELYSAILDYFSRDISTIDDQIVRDSLYDTLEDLEVDTFESLNNIQSEDFLITFIINFAVKNFEECFAEKILSKQENIDRYDMIIEDVENLIGDRILADMKIKDILKMDFLSDDGQEYINNICKLSYDSLKTIGEVYYENLD